MGERTLVVGESLVDIVRGADGAVVEHPGGSPLNVAIGLARLGHSALLATWLADDERGRAVAAHLRADNVEVVPGSLGAERTSTATAMLDENHAATYEFDLDWQVPQPLPGNVGHLHTGSIAAVLQPGAAAVRDAVIEHRPTTTISLDPNARPSLMGEPADVRSGIEELVGYADVVKASDEDIHWLYGADVDLEQVLRLWSQLGPTITVATLGGHGALAYVPRDDLVIRVAGHEVAVIDTVGAGDSFMSALISGLLDRGLLGSAAARARLQDAAAEDFEEVLREAVAAAAITVSRAGAQPPTRADLGL